MKILVCFTGPKLSFRNIFSICNITLFDTKPYLWYLKLLIVRQTDFSKFRNRKEKMKKKMMTYKNKSDYLKQFSLVFFIFSFIFFMQSLMFFQSLPWNMSRKSVRMFSHSFFPGNPKTFRNLFCNNFFSSTDHVFFSVRPVKSKYLSTFVNILTSVTKMT